MTKPLSTMMLEATRLTRLGRLTEASALLRRLTGAGEAAPTAKAPPGRRIIDVDAETGDAAVPPPGMAEATKALLGRFGRRVAAPAAAPRTAAPMPAGARFVAGSHAGQGRTLGYKLYIPAHRPTAPPALIVMLHGCTQSPDDFAAGTRMNVRAEEHGCIVAYPCQTESANAQRCWNWFRPGDQARDGGEPALIAGLTRQVMRDQAVDPGRVFIAGLSAGGAAAAIMAQAYPDLYAAVGVHSGLACGAARDLPSALAAMRQGAAATPSGRAVPTIVFHADADATVHPRNGDQVAAQAVAAGLTKETHKGSIPGGHGFTRTIHRDAAGRAMLEQWTVHGGGHAWSGGDAAGSYTDGKGPDASREMLRFFLEKR